MMMMMLMMMMMMMMMMVSGGRRVVEVMPEHAESRYNFGTLFLRMGRYVCWNTSAFFIVIITETTEAIRC